MNTCCYSHDVKTGPNGITYFIHTYNDPNPLSQMTNANLTAVGNACGYSTITTPGNFSGQVRRFPEFLQIPDLPIANADTITIAAGNTVVLNPLINDSDPQGDPISLTGIVTQPLLGSASINGNQLNYIPNPGVCSGTDTITYMITDNTCLCDTAQIIIYIQGALPQAAFTYSTNGICVSDTVYFTDSSANAVTVVWNFGDNTTSQLNNPVHVYTNPGSYLVSLIVSNSCSTDTVQQLINVSNVQLPQAVFTAVQQSCNLSIVCTNSSSNATSWQWNFGDGDTSFLQTPGHICVSRKLQCNVNCNQCMFCR